MILNKLDEFNSQEIQIVIIGSGPAGISLALELEKKNLKTLIVEAGDEKYSQFSQDNFNSEIVGDKIIDLSHSRLRQFGGTSAIWGGWSKPMENYNIKKWGINNNKLSKYSKSTCQILNIKNEFRKSSLDKYFSQIEFQYSQVKFANKFKDHISKSKNINLILNTQLSHFVGANKKINYALCISKGVEYKIQAKYFVLACGGIENSRVLLWTREKNNNLINPMSPIGKYWMTHPWFLGGIGILKKNEIQKILKKKFINYDGPLHISTNKKLIEEKNILSGGMYMTAEEDTQTYKEIVKDLLCVAPNFGKKLARTFFKKDLKCGNIFMHMEEPPSINNQIQLHENLKDSNNIPITKLFYKKSKKTIKSAKIILEEFGNFCIKNDLGRIAIKDNIYNISDYESLGVNHHLGGTRIGTNDKESVIDKNLKVHNAINLYVNGSSNFSTAGYTNPTYTIIQLSLRLADEIALKI